MKLDQPIVLNKSKASKVRGGFALLTVLLGMATLLTIYTLLAQQSSSLTGQARRMNILEERALAMDSLAHWARFRIHATDPLDFDNSIIERVVISGRIWIVTLADTAGRIDLNTASPGLLRRILSSDHVERLLGAREERIRFQDLTEAAAYLEVPPGQMGWLRDVATVHSGRDGIAQGHASPSVRDVLEDPPEAPPTRRLYTLDIRSDAGVELGRVLLDRGVDPRQPPRIIGYE